MEDDGSENEAKRRVLVIDDDEAACCLVEDILSLDGIVVEKAVGGEAGVRLISKKSFPIIITDLKMPDIDGLGVIDFIKKRGMESLVIVITGYVSIDSVIGALRAGAYDYIIKPFSAELLRLTVERAFDYIELMRNKQKARYLDAITQLAQTTAHEISQPLTLVIGRTKEICDNAQNPEIRELADQVLEYARKIKDIVRKIDGINAYAIKSYPGGYTLVDIDKASSGGSQDP